MKKLYFISYGDDNYKNSKIRLEHEAINSKFFDFIKIFNREDLSEDFIKKTRPYIDMPRGGGYWLWKSFFLKKIFEVMEENDYCIYVDAGCMVNSLGLNRLKEYLEMINDDSGILSFELTGLPEECYNTEIVFKHFGVEKDDKYRKSSQFVGGILVIRKCSNSQKIINEYYDLAINNTHLFSDINNFSDNCQSFIDHRHDQSILSILRKKYGSVVLQDETYAGTMEDWNNLIYNKKIPFLATRIRN
jgi:hypothetical protein